MKPLQHRVLTQKLILSWLVHSTLWWAIFLLKCVLKPLFAFQRQLSQKKACPAITSRLLLLPASDLAKKIRTREVTCTEVVGAYVERVREVNPLLNAVVQDRFDEALKEAKDIDNLLVSGSLTEQQLQESKPLLGVPLTVKESIAVKGLSNNAAFSRVKSRVAKEDAEVVRLMKDAGAVVLLVSNTPELCLNFETYNPRVGTTNNPYDVRRTPAGSSGGEAALLGSAASVIGLGSDICGSLRLPAMFTGVYGHKPTPGFVNNTGHWPTSRDENWDRFFTLGPMCRYAVDLPVLMNTLVPDPRRLELRLDQEVDLSLVRLFYLEEDSPRRVVADPVDETIKTALRRSVSHLHSEYGMTVQQAPIKGLEVLLNLYTVLMARMKDITSVFQKDGDHPDEWRSVVLEIVKKVMCTSSASLTCLLYGPLKTIVDNISDEEIQKLLDKKDHIKKQFKDMLGDDGVFLYPTFPEPAHFHKEICYKIINVGYLSLFNLLELPCTACPLGLNKDGLPIGIQISAWQKQDRLTLAVAKALEKEFGGWVPPCLTL